MLPTTAEPVWMPMRVWIGGRPRRASSAEIRALTSSARSAARIAAPAVVVDAIGAPKKAMIASPMNLSITPCSASSGWHMRVK
jgi:hypothetical protein